MKQTKSKLLNIIGWLMLGVGLLLYVVPLFFETTGHYSGLLAFGVIFIGITLLKYRKDQLNK